MYNNSYTVTTIFQFIIILLAVMTVFSNYAEVTMYFTGEIQSQAVLTSSVFVKLSKEFVIFALILYFLTKYHRVNKKALLILIFIIIIVLISFIYSSLHSHKDITNIHILATIRFFLPLFLLVVLLGKINQQHVEFLTFVIIILFIIHFAMQLLEIFYASAWHGSVYKGMNFRVSGIFLITNTAAMLATFYVYLVLYSNNINEIYKYILIILGIISVFITSSLVGIVSVFLLILMFLYHKSKLIRLFIPLGLFLIFFYIKYYVVLMRGSDYLEISGGSRLELFLEAVSNNLFFSEQFGYWLNASVLLGDGKIADSLWAALFGSFGGIVAITFFFIIIFNILKYIHSLKTVSLFSVFMLFSTTTTMFEIYPMNYMFSLVFAYLLFQSSNIQLSKSKYI